MLHGHGEQKIVSGYYKMMFGKPHLPPKKHERSRQSPHKLPIQNFPSTK
jgi:hypothetical protein